MQATSIVATSAPARNALLSRAFVSSGQAAEYAGVSRQTIINYIERGELDCIKTSGGHTRVKTASLLTLVDGIDPAEQQTELSETKGVVLYARVSSDKQKQAGSLDRQIERLRTETGEAESIDPEAIPLYSDCASSFGERKALNALVDAMLDGKVRKVYVLYMDRLSRVPSTTSLLNHIARRCNVEIIALEAENQDEEEDNFFISELIAFITVISNRVSAAKSRKVTVKNVAPETVKRLAALRGQGLSLTAIWKQADKEGLTTETGDSLSYYKIKELLESKAIGVAVGEDFANPQDLLNQFITEQVEPTEAPKARVYSDELSEAYRVFCEANAVSPLPNSELGIAIARKYGKDCRFKTMGKVAYRGLSLKAA